MKFTWLKSVYGPDIQMIVISRIYQVSLDSSCLKNVKQITEIQCHP
jgi:hypothetical protein